MQKETAKKIDTIKSIPDGGMLTIAVKPDESVHAWQQRVYEINRAEGWQHYTVSVRKAIGQVIIIANDPV